MFLGRGNLLIKDGRIERQVMQRVSVAPALPTTLTPCLPTYTPPIVCHVVCLVNFKGHAQTLDSIVVSYFLPVPCGKKTVWTPWQHVPPAPFPSPPHTVMEGGSTPQAEVEPGEEPCLLLSPTRTCRALKQPTFHFLRSVPAGMGLRPL